MPLCHEDTLPVLQKYPTKDTVPYLPNSVRRQAREAMADILKASSAARQQALGLQHVNYGGGLKTELFNFNDSAEKLYGQMQTAILQKLPDRKLKKMINKCREKLDWYKQAEALQLSTTRTPNYEPVLLMQPELSSHELINIFNSLLYLEPQMYLL